jgi:4'-phosphopantetheinyl transferase
MNPAEPDWQTIVLPLSGNRPPGKAEVDLWLVDLNELPLEAGPTGLTRKEKVLKRRIQQQFVLRLLLGSYLGKPGKDIRIEKSAAGKPSVIGSDLEFNLSHSGAWLGIALTTGHPIGLDIEINRPMRRPVELARRFFSRNEAEAIEALEEPKRSHSFLTQWTAREALVKAADTTMAASLAHLQLGIDPFEILSVPSSWPGPDQWCLVNPACPADLVMHVASPARIDRLKGFLLKT